MGARSWRGFWSFERLGGVETLAATELKTQAIEDNFRDPVSGDRRVNVAQPRRLAVDSSAD